MHCKGNNIFAEWLVSEGENADFEVDDVPELAIKLRRFYACARGTDGREYSRSSLTNIRSGLNRHLTSPPHGRQINLMRDIEFQAANQVFVGRVRKLRQDGLDKTQHKDAVSNNDMKRLYESGVLSTEHPLGLQRKVYVEISLHFCRRGREGLRELRKDSFVLKHDENDREYVTIAYNELEKNHQGVSKHDIGQEPRMYGQDGDMCPVKSFKLYISKLNAQCGAFYQRPNANFKNSGVWFCNMPVGKNLLSTMMKSISEAASLSKTYTNHCLRVTAVSVLHGNGVAPMDICSVSRHRNTESLKSYCQGPSDEKRFSMSALLHGHGKQSTAVVPVSQSASAPQPSTSTGRGLNRESSDMTVAVPAAATPAQEPDLGVSHGTNTAISNRHENVLQTALFAGAHFEANCAPVFNFHGSFHFN